MRHPLLRFTSTLFCLVTGCTDEPTITGSQQTVISDGAHGANPHFFFLPPMVPHPTVNGSFDATREPAVEICELDATGACLAPLVARFGAEAITLDTTAELYAVSWHTDSANLDATKTYRVRIGVGGHVLGFADLDVVSNGKELRDVQTGDYIPLLDGRTLPIKFRIEDGAVPTLVEHDASELLAWHSGGGPWLAELDGGALYIGGRIHDRTTGAIVAGEYSDYATSIYVSVNEHLIIRSHENTHAFRPDLTHVWAADTGGCCNYAAAMTAIDRHNGRGYFGSINGAVYEIDLDAGMTVRATNSPGQVWTAIDGDTLYDYRNGGVVTRLDRTTLAPSWTIQVPDTAQLSHAAIASDGSLIASTGGNRAFKDFDLRSQPGGRLVRVRPDGGTELSTPGDTVGNPVIGSNGLVFVGWQPGGYDDAATTGGVAAYGPDGQLAWSIDLGASPLDLLVGDDGRVYVAMADRTVHALDVSTGEHALAISNLPASGGWMILSDGLLVTSAGVALQLPAGFARDYDPASPWPVWRHDNRRTANARD